MARWGGALAALALVVSAPAMSSAAEVRGSGSAPTPEVAAQIQAVEAKLRANADDPSLYTADMISIHGSGWIYTREQNIAIRKNTGILFPGGRGDVIKANHLKYRTVMAGPDTAIVTGVDEVYLAIPDPEDVAIKAGTLTRDPEATAKAIAARNLPTGSLGPGETGTPNPYRTRNTRVWVREGGQWKLALDQSTRITERTGRISVDH